MKLKHACLLTLLSGVLFTAIGAVIPFIKFQNHISESGAIGIIGGADTPTYEFNVLRIIMNGWPFVVILLGITLTVSALLCLMFAKAVKNNCNVKTSVASLGISAVGAMGLVCFFLWLTIAAFHEMSKHPITYPLSVSLGLLCLLLFFVLIAIYLWLRKKTWSIKGVIIDVLTSIIYLPVF